MEQTMEDLKEHSNRKMAVHSGNARRVALGAHLLQNV